MTFRDRLDAAVASSSSLLCLGLDPADSDLAGAERTCRDLLQSCLEAVCAVKPNMAFFEQHGPAGYALLEKLRKDIPGDRILLIDAKRGDIGSTAQAYARAVFDVLGADAVTLNPLMGEDSVAPFLAHADRGVFLLTRTSNPGAADFLEQKLASGEPLYERIVSTSATWPGAAGAVGYVVGATDPFAVAAVRKLASDAPLLTPGVGAQGGDLEATVSAGLDSRGGGMLIPLSRGIAKAADPGAAATELRDAINDIRTARRRSA